MEPQGRGPVCLDVMFLSLGLALCMECGQEVRFSGTSLFRAGVTDGSVIVPTFNLSVDGCSLVPSPKP